jgi:hypothetical protein
MFLNTQSGLPGNQSFSSAESRAASPAGLAPGGQPALLATPLEGKSTLAGIAPRAANLAGHCPGIAPDNSKAVNAG